MKKEVRQAIYDKYIAPTKKERPDYIGVEIEMPVVNLSGQPVDEAVSIKTAESFIKNFGFIESGKDSNGSITSAKHEETGDILSFVSMPIDRKPQVSPAAFFIIVVSVKI